MPKFVKQTVLTRELKESIDAIKFTKIERNKAYRLLDILFNYILIDKYKASEYIPLAKNLFIKIFKDSRYSKWLKKLVENKILLPQKNLNGSATYYLGHCIHYKINPDLLTENIVGVEILLPEEHQNIKILDEDWDDEFIKQEIRSLIINERKLLAAAKEAVDNISVNDFILDNNIKALKLEVYNSFNQKKYYTTLPKAIATAKNHFCNLIQDKNRYVIDNVDSYLRTKKENTLKRYVLAIKKLCKGVVYASRNETNQRLDHNLTSMGKSLLKIIKEDNDLIEIDLANSQFAILAYAMKQDQEFNTTPDFNVFKFHTGNGTHYNHLATTMSITRDEAKLIMMQVGFSSHKKGSAEKTLFAKQFPSVAKYINDYKKESKDSNQFAIDMQRFESRLFIDHFYNQLKRDGVWVITKHDSLLVKKDDVEKVLTYLNECAATIDFDCTFRPDIIKPTTEKVVTIKKKEFTADKFWEEVEKYKDYTDQELGVKSIEQRWREDHFFEPEWRIKQAYINERHSAIEKIIKAI